MLLSQFVEVGYVPNQSPVVELLDCCITGDYVHSLAAEEVHELRLNLCRAAVSVRTE